MGGKYIGSISINAPNFEQMFIRPAIGFLAAGSGGKYFDRFLQILAQSLESSLIDPILFVSKAVSFNSAKQLR
jgi:hypothetical protein